MLIEIEDNLYLETVNIIDANEVFEIVESSRNSLREWLPWVDLTKSTKDIEKYFQTCIDREIK